MAATLSRIRQALLGCMLLAAAGAAAARSAGPGSAPPVLPVEEPDVAVLPPAGPHRLFLFDAYGASGANVIEGDDEKLASKGLVQTARNAAMSLSRDGATVFVAETYWSRGNRGDRVDLLSLYDGTTLALQKEIALPGRLLVVPKLQQVATSDDGALAYVYDLIPSSLVHVVDLAAGKVTASVELPGCALAYPFGARSFATVCGDGTIGVATIPPSGAARTTFTKPFFDPDGDPLFENSVVDRTSGEGWFLSFSGKVYPVKLGATATVAKPWSLTAAAGLPASGTGVQELAWRPGGGQMLALHRTTRRLFVLMHPGNYWTHKTDGGEVWVFDAARQTLLRRIKLPRDVHSIAVSQDAKPLLYALGGDREGGLIVLDATTGEKLRETKISGDIGLVPGL